MPRINIPKRAPKRPRPEIVTGNFQMHYEELVRKNRFMAIALVGFTIAGLSAIIPIATYRSQAATNSISIESENGTQSDPAKAVKVTGDASASNGSYIKFTPAAPPATGGGTGGGTGGSGGTVASGTRDKYKWPFSRYSIWNMPLGSNANYISANIGDFYMDGQDWMLYSDADLISLDPNGSQTQVQKINNDDVYVLGSAWNMGLDQQQFRCATPGSVIDTVLLPSGWRTELEGVTPNASAALLKPDKNSVLDTQPFTRCSNGKATSQFQTVSVPLNGDGIQGSHGGTGMSALGGAIRLHELAANYPRDGIKHALKLVLNERFNFSCTPIPSSANYSVRYGNKNCSRWPALNPDGDAGSSSCPGHGYCGSVPDLKPGSLLALDPNFNIESLKTEIGKRFAWTFQNYGGYVVDSTGWVASILQLEQGPGGIGKNIFKQNFGYEFEGSQGERNSNPWMSDYYTMMKSLKVVTNNAPNKIGGGGTPRQPLAPAFSDGTPDGITTNPNQ